MLENRRDDATRESNVVRKWLCLFLACFTLRRCRCLPCRYRFFTSPQPNNASDRVSFFFFTPPPAVRNTISVNSKNPKILKLQRSYTSGHSNNRKINIIRRNICWAIDTTFVSSVITQLHSPGIKIKKKNNKPHWAKASVCITIIRNWGWAWVSCTHKCNLSHALTRLSRLRSWRHTWLCISGGYCSKRCWRKTQANRARLLAGKKEIK